MSVQVMSSAAWKRAAALAVGQRIRSARVAAGLSQGGLAELCASHRPIICRIEKGRHLPDLETLYRVAHVLRVSVTELVAPLNVLQRWLPR